MKKFIFTRSAIVEEVFEIEAETEDAARERLFDPPAPVATNWLDWYNDDYSLDAVDELTEIAQKHNMGY